jgi:hypothetical protein
MIALSNQTTEQMEDAATAVEMRVAIEACRTQLLALAKKSHRELVICGWTLERTVNAYADDLISETTGYIEKAWEV